uniref:Uncharacterized protein n=1 Tax=Rhizophora mucronata TaxID=61149 RepID=A0A2P2PCF6_RHIMU
MQAVFWNSDMGCSRTIQIRMQFTHATVGVDNHVIGQFFPIR